MSRLVTYFRGEGYARFGYEGDLKGETPHECAIRNLKEFDALLRTKAGSDAYTALQAQRLRDMGLVPA